MNHQPTKPSRDVQDLAPARLAVDADKIRAYAELTEDFNPIHLDHEFAAATPMKGVIAHGTMSILLLWQALANTFGDEALAGIDLDIRFVRPVRIGEMLVAGGRRSDDSPARYEVWVRTEAGEDRLVGTAVLSHAQASSTAAATP